MIRLMIVDDSATFRDMMVFTLSSEPDIEIVSVAEDGQEALEMLNKIKPDIILMDVNMPRLNGYETSLKIMQSKPIPILLMTATWDISEVDKIVENMNIGVLGVYEKPYGIGHPKYKELYEKIVSDIRVMSEVKVVRRWKSDGKKNTDDFAGLYNINFKRGEKIILIGSSTGGPLVLNNILKSLEEDYPFPILVAQHINSAFIDSLIEWLDSQCILKVKKVADGEKIVAGHIYIAPSFYHLTVQNYSIKLIKADKDDLYVPSVSRLFASVESQASQTIAILLSGMGDDGSDEITKLKYGGAVTIAQNEATSVVFGMANEAIKKGGIDFVLTPHGITELLLDMKTNGEVL